MQAMLVVGVIVVPLLMFLLRNRGIAVLFDLLAAVALWLFGISAGLVVLQIKMDSTEMTTHVHQIFMDPIFLLSSGYIGLYAIYRMLVTSSRTWARFNGTEEETPLGKSKRYDQI